MAKKFEKKLLSSAMAVALASGIGFSGSASAIHLAEDGIGQVLLAPYYTVLNNYTTEVAIVNTRADKAVKAKVVLRSRAQSTEVLDFICYLTPADVCRFTIRTNADGQAEVYSTDDSLKQRTANAFATEAAPAIYPVFDDRMKGRDTADVNEWGHLEVIGVYAVDAGATAATAVPVRVNSTATGVVNVYRTMPKTELARIFDTPRATLNAVDVANAETSESVDGLLTVSGTKGGKIRSADEDWVRLMGTVETVKKDKSDRYGYRIPALAGEPLDNQLADAAGVAVIDPGTAAVFDGRVISNSTFDVNGNAGAAETTIGAGFSEKGGRDNIFEIENALVADNVYGEYDVRSSNGVTEGTGVLITFPTRYRHRGNDVCGIVTSRGVDAQGRPLAIDPYYTYPFTRDGWIQFNRMQYNNMEALKDQPVIVDNVSGGDKPPEQPNWLYAEVNAMMMAPNGTWDTFANSGWFNIDLVEAPYTGTISYGTQCAYNGVPTIALVYDWMSSNSAPAMGNVMNSQLTPASSSPERTNTLLDSATYPVGNDMQ